MNVGGRGPCPIFGRPNSMSFRGAAPEGGGGLSKKASACFIYSSSDKPGAEAEAPKRGADSPLLDPWTSPSSPFPPARQGPPRA